MLASVCVFVCLHMAHRYAVLAGALTGGREARPGQGVPYVELAGCPLVLIVRRSHPDSAAWLAGFGRDQTAIPCVYSNTGPDGELFIDSSPVCQLYVLTASQMVTK